MNNILITGATGNIGFEVIKFLYKMGTKDRIIAGVRQRDKARKIFKDVAQLSYVDFDFDRPEMFQKSLEGIDRVFLLRPPHISDTEKYFRPLIEKIKEQGVRQVIFLSVQGAEKSKVIPHHRIEGLIKETGIDYIFLRPSYFMQNLTTTLLDDIVKKRKIILPAGNAKFNWIDVENIGETAAMLFEQFDEYKNRAIELTGYQNRSFYEVTDLINQSIERKITFENTNPLKYYTIKKKDGLTRGMIFVMLMLHFLPRFQKEPEISGFYEMLTGKKPTSLKEFIQRENKKFEKNSKEQ